MTTTIRTDRSTTRTRPDARQALHIDADGVTVVVGKGARVLSGVTLGIEPGRLVAVIGASGAGKTTLLEALAGLRHPSSGAVRYDGWDVREHREAFRTLVGYVPQADIIHTDLPVRATVLHAARLRLPHVPAAELDELVDRTIAVLGLAERASTTVGRLSGGQRKRVSIAVELLSRPRAFFLDEPTSGLDPGTARNLLSTLRSLAGDESTIVMTTHSPDDVMACDEVIVLGQGGRLVFHGTPLDALDRFGVDDVTDIYRALERAADVRPGAKPARHRSAPPLRAPSEAPPAAPPAGSLHQQWRALVRRNVDVLIRNRLTMAIMLGAPVLVVAMLVILFQPGAFDAGGGDPTAAVSMVYWLAFSAFFFGLTYGLLQVCTEIAVVRRERHVGLDLGAYVLAKMTVLVPVLFFANAAMVLALVSTHRLPATGWSTTATLIGVLLLDALAALALGLLASAAVAEPSHATLALPMLCFPAVLFGGAVLPTHTMAATGQAISAVTADRWAFEALARALGLGSRFASQPTAALVRQQFGGAFAGAITSHLAILVVFTAGFLAMAVRVLRRRTAVR